MKLSYEKTIPQHFNMEMNEEQLDALKKPEQGYFYLASPYSKWEDREEACEAVSKVWAELHNEGICCISPIAGSHQATKFGAAGRWEDWKRLDTALIVNPMCLGIIVVKFDGWKESVGVTEEIAIARNNQKPVFYMEA